MFIYHYKQLESSILWKTLYLSAASVSLHSRRPRVALLLFMETLCIMALYRVMWFPQSREPIYLKRPDFALMHLVPAILCTERVPVELGD